MFNSGNGYSLADLATAVKGEEGGFAQGGAWWIIILFLFIFMGNGQFGGNGARQAASTEDVQNQFNFASLERQNNEIIATTRQAHYDTVSATKDLAYNNLSAIKDLSMDNVISSNAIQAELSRMGYAQQACCCETNRNIDAVRFENAQNTCAITNAIHNEGEITRALINANMVQDLRDKLADARLTNSQCAQNAYLVNTLQPMAKPAYIVGSPYASVSTCCPGII